VDAANHVVFEACKLSADGELALACGRIGVAGSEDGARATATLSSPRCVRC
jgi:hypothetical protein